MRKAAALLVLALLPLAFLSFRGPGLKPVACNPDAGTEGTTELSSVVGAQVRQLGMIRGRVCSLSGPDTVWLPGAQVSLAGTGLSTVTDGGGHFWFSVRPGPYAVRARVPGYAPARVEATVIMGVVAEPKICVDTPVVPKTVEIEVDRGRRTVTVSPDPLYIAPGDYVEWLIAGDSVYPWTVHFSPMSPLAHRRILSNGEPLGGSVRADVFPGKYSYFVAVAVGDRVFTADPELIDENEEVRGGPH